MNSKLSRELKWYYRDIDNSLLCDRHRKRQILSSIRFGILDFMDNNPNADINTIKGHFGTPKQIADEYYNNTDADEIKMKINSKIGIAISIVIVLAVMLLLYIVSVIFVTDKSVKEVNGYYLEYIGDISETDIYQNDISKIYTE